MRASRTLPLLLEIGCEEIPARFLTEAQKALGERLATALREASLLPPSAAPIQTYSTPRRLVAYVPGVSERQPEKVEQLLGPPLHAALNSEGNPTRAAESFAAKNSAQTRDLVRVKTPKGYYLALKKTIPGRLAQEILPEVLPAVVTGLTFPKNMYWLGKAGPRFIRPIRWLLALLGEGKQARTIQFEVAGVTTGNSTYGHRRVAKAPIRVGGFKDYSRKLGKAQVELDPGRRREKVRDQSKVILEDLGLTTIPDRELEDWVVNSTEWPHALLGNFDRRFLSLPPEILVTVMRDHQKYFAVKDRKGNLQPHFIAVANSDGDPKGLICAGHERVLVARFTDAEFFWNTDQRLVLEGRRDLLAAVTFQTQLGSYREKVSRIRLIAEGLCRLLEAQGKLAATDTGHIMRAVELCKCDLTTQMVQEFPELQGVVGGLYARAQGEPAPVAEAIYDHYLPESLDDRCPRSLIGAVISLADKIDGVASGFALGLEPTGSSDPFALRRQGNGIIKVLLELSLALPLDVLVGSALSALDVRQKEGQLEVRARVCDFLRERLSHYLEGFRKFRYDTVRAILAAGWDPPLEALRRTEALEAIRGSQDLQALSVSAKRIKNILAKSASSSDWQPGEVEEGNLREDPERNLYRAYVSVAAEAANLTPAAEYLKALSLIATLRPYVDHFFDKVLVMTEDPGLRQNRLRLLGKLDELFSGIARFAEIAGAPSSVDASTSQGVRAER